MLKVSNQAVYRGIKILIPLEFAINVIELIFTVEKLTSYWVVLC
jgi:hypothetical protein